MIRIQRLSPFTLATPVSCIPFQPDLPSLNPTPAFACPMCTSHPPLFAHSALNWHPIVLLAIYWHCFPAQRKDLNHMIVSRCAELTQLLLYPSAPVTSKSELGNVCAAFSGIGGLSSGSSYAWVYLALPGMAAEADYTALMSSCRLCRRGQGKALLYLTVTTQGQEPGQHEPQ